jgi:hypothetical protein
MHFFLYEIVARIAGLWMCCACSEKAWRGLVERKISPWRDFLDFYKLSYQRDTMPIRYWTEIGQMVVGAAAGLVVALLGWWQPNT